MPFICLECNKVFDHEDSVHFIKNHLVKENKEGELEMVWFPPQDEKEEIYNSDGSLRAVKGGGVLGGIGLVRRSLEGFEEGYQIFLGEQKDIEAIECFGILLSLSLAEMRKSKVPKIQSDCLRAVQFINGERKVPGNLVDIVEACRELLKRNPTFNLEFVYREINTVVDWLAKQSVTERRTRLYASATIPCFLDRLLVEDASCIIRVRCRRKQK